MPKRVFRVEVHFDNQRWKSADLAEYIRTEVQAGQGHMRPEDSPDITEVIVNPAGRAHGD